MKRNRGLSLKSQFMLSILPVVAIIIILNSLYTGRKLVSKIGEYGYESQKSAVIHQAEMVREAVLSKAERIETLTEYFKKEADFDSASMNREISSIYKTFPNADNRTFFYTNEKGAITLNDAYIDLSYRDYVKETIRTKKRFISDVIVDSQTGDFMMVISVPILDPEGTFHGAINASMRLNDLLKEIKFRTDSGGFGYILSGSGVVIHHPLPEHVGKTLEETAPPDVAEALIGTVFSNQAEGRISYIFEGEHREGYFYTIPELGWKVVQVRDAMELKNEIRRTIIETIVVVLSFTAVIGIILYLVTGFITKKISLVSAAIGEIAQGGGDLTRRLEIKGRDETARLSEGFNAFVDSLNTIVGDIKRASASLAEVGTSLGGNMEETSAAIHQISSNITGVRQQVSAQNGAIENTGSAVEQMLGNIDALARNIEVQAERVSESSSSIEEMIQSIRQLTANLEKISRAADSLETISLEGKSELERTNEQIRQIEMQSESLAETNQIISSVADKTNLLAMNAAIEAAHAGDAGRGFAVVADEIRKLAEQASVESSRTEQNLGAIQNLIHSIVKSSELTEKTFARTTSEISVVKDLINEEKLAMEEQTIGGRNVLQALDQINSITHEVRTGSREMQTGSRMILEAHETLKRINDELNYSAGEMDSGASEISKAVADVQQLSQKNRQEIEIVQVITSRFKTE